MIVIFSYLKYMKKTINDLIDDMNKLDNIWGILQLAICNRHDHNIRLSNEKDLIKKDLETARPVI